MGTFGAGLQRRLAVHQICPIECGSLGSDQPCDRRLAQLLRGLPQKALVDALDQDDLREALSETRKG